MNPLGREYGISWVNPACSVPYSGTNLGSSFSDSAMKRGSLASVSPGLIGVTKRTNAPSLRPWGPGRRGQGATERTLARPTLSVHPQHNAHAVTHTTVLIFPIAFF